MSPSKRRGLIVAAVCGAMMSEASSAAVIGYWRMESDTDGGASLSVPNEFVTGSPLTAPTASLQSGVPVNPVPQTAAANLLALNGDANVDGTVNSYTELNVNSITVELFARTAETSGDLIKRISGTTGWNMTSYNNVTVTYFVGTETIGRTVSGTSAIDLGTTWTHLAFTYDQTTGVGSIYADGVLRGTNVGTPGALNNATTTNLLIGTGMDGGTLSAATTSPFLDEVRISDVALTPANFLNVPEPAFTAPLLLTSLALMRRRRG